MPHRDHSFPVVLEHEPDPADPLRTLAWYRLAGRRYGPFATVDAMEQDLVPRLKRWDTRAREFGGWAWRRAHLELVVTLPEGVPVEGGEWLAPWVRKA